MNRPLRIGFLHPDLGLGGAERLVVDAALELQTAGHQVTIFTAHHDPTQCFEETRDGTLNVLVYGHFLPGTIGGRLLAPCAILRMFYAAMRLTLRNGPFDIIFCDLVSHAIPMLRLFSSARIIFYCHFPDQLLTPPRQSWYQWYRAPIDRLEEITTGQADRILVNSQFTAQVFHTTFPRLHNLTPEVVYPGVDCTVFEQQTTRSSPSTAPDITLLSINRYEGKKNIGLAISALAWVRTQISLALFARVRLVIAGGYDERLQDDRQTFRFLQEQAQQLDLSQQITLLRSISNNERAALLAQCRGVVYTPENEHFGYGPLEAMAAARPVIAANSGGPTETIRNEETGFLCPPTPEAFAAAMQILICDPETAIRMGQAGKVHVQQNFSRTAFGQRLCHIVHELIDPNSNLCSPLSKNA